MTHPNDDQDRERFERSLRVWMTEGRPPLVDRDTQIQGVLESLDEAPQAKPRFRLWWNRRGHDAGKRPPASSRSNRLMFRVVAVTGAIALLALSVRVVDVAQTPLDPGTALMHVVAADGTADFATIGAAVKAASAGDSISVKPGRYAESIAIDKDLSLVGDGPREDVVIVTPDDLIGRRRLNEAERPYGVLLDASKVRIADLTIAVPMTSTGIVARSGAPLIERVSFEGIHVEGSPWWDDAYFAMGFFGDTTPTVRESDWDGYTAVRDGATAVFEDNAISKGIVSIDGPGESFVRSNFFSDGASISSSQEAKGAIEGNDFTGSSVGVDTGSNIEVRGNTFRDLIGAGEDPAVYVFGEGTNATIVDNTLVNVITGIRTGDGTTVEITGNSLDVTLLGVVAAVSDAILVEGNTIRGAGAGIEVLSGAAPIIRGNTVDVTGRGIFIAQDSAPVVSNNEVCGTSGSIHVAESATPTLSDNLTCEPA